MQREKNDMLAQELDSVRRQMQTMTPRVALIAKKSSRNSEKKAFDFN